MDGVAFGIWDHIERRAGVPLQQLYEERLQLLEQADAGPFRGYHLAEHHCTPLGMAPSPSLFLAAAAQRTRRLRLGSMVHLLPLYHPLRLIEEVCMLDQLSSGRLDLGVGRGVSPFELLHYGVDPLTARERFDETLDLLLRGLAGNGLTHEGRHHSFRDAPLVLEPLQRPHPPLWYGASSLAGVEQAAQRGFNVIAVGPEAALAQQRAAFNAARARGRETGPLPPDGGAPARMGALRLAFIDDTDAAAERVARAAYPVFYDSLQALFVQNGLVSRQFPQSYDELAAYGMFLVGSAASVRAQVERLVERTGIDYLLLEVCWGSIDHAQASDSLGLCGEIAEALAG